MVNSYISSLAKSLIKLWMVAYFWEMAFAYLPIIMTYAISLPKNDNFRSGTSFPQPRANEWYHLWYCNQVGFILTYSTLEKVTSIWSKGSRFNCFPSPSHLYCLVIYQYPLSLIIWAYPTFGTEQSNWLSCHGMRVFSFILDFQCLFQCQWYVFWRTHPFPLWVGNQFWSSHPHPIKLNSQIWGCVVTTETHCTILLAF